MPRFPLKEAEILRLAREMVAGFNKHRQEFPRPIVPIEQMEQELADAQASLNSWTRARAAAKLATAEKERRFKSLAETMSVNLRYAETLARRNPKLLQALGWGPRHTRRAMRPPGEVRSLRILEQTETVVDLAWKKPVDGGRVVVYRVERQTGGGEWVVAASIPTTGVRLEGEERGVDLAYRVIAMNKAGEGSPSATVQAVL
jgi:Fibronectin type III domain